MIYHMPAEWEPHKGTWLAWPHNKEHWPGKFDPILQIYAEIVSALLEAGEEVFICVNNAAMEVEAHSVIASACLPDRQAAKQSHKNPLIHFSHILTNASWSRDHGPIFVRDEKGRPVITDWIFNCWGKKYPPWNLDDQVPQKIAQKLNMPIIQPGIILEGGSIDVNGKGTLLTTEQCLLNKNRNPHLTHAQIEKYLHDFLGATNILWLKEGIVGDDTDGHIDDIARFTDEKTVVCCIEENRADENHEILKKNFDNLQKMKDQDCKPFNVVAIPMPDPVFFDGQRLPASYANFYIANKAVLVPTFRCAKDAVALKILGQLFSGRKIIPIDCVDLVWGLGAIHCSTQQQPG